MIFRINDHNSEANLHIRKDFFHSPSVSKWQPFCGPFSQLQAKLRSTVHKTTSIILQRHQGCGFSFKLKNIGNHHFNIELVEENYNMANDGGGP